MKMLKFGTNLCVFEVRIRKPLGVSTSKEMDKMLPLPPTVQKYVGYGRCRGALLTSFGGWNLHQVIEFPPIRPPAQLRTFNHVLSHFYWIT